MVFRTRRDSRLTVAPVNLSAPSRFRADGAPFFNFRDEYGRSIGCTTRIVSGMITADGIEALYGLPKTVVFCKSCVMSNQRPSSYPEFKHTQDRITPTLHIGDDGVCDACRFAQRKENIDWDDRERQLVALLNRYRRTDGPNRRRGSPRCA